jgi:kynurenine formamidase
MGYIDLTHTFAEDMSVFPGGEKVSVREIAYVGTDGYHETRLSFTSHTGTHVDAPAHVFPDGITLDRLDPSSFFGTAAVIDCTDIGPGGVIPLSAVERQSGEIRGADFLLFHTGRERYWGTDRFCENMPVISREVAEYVALHTAKGIGVDVISVDPIDSEDMPNHHIILAEGRLIIENLKNLALLGSGVCRLYVFPFKYIDSDGSPARVIAETE